MEPTPSPPGDPGAPKRRRRALLVTASVVATALVVALVVAAAGDGNGSGDEDAEDHAVPGTNAPDGPEAVTTTGPPPTSSSETTGAGPSTTSTPPGPAQGGTFDDGRWAVGNDIPPGRYIAAGIDGNRCDWARLAGGTTGDSVIAAENDVANQAIVDILRSDAAFRTSGCGTWARYTAPAPPPLATIDEGDWVVGEQIEPGAYRAPQAATCSWARASGFEHIPREVTQTQDTNIALEGPFLVTLTAGERFTSRGCATWTRAD